MQALFLIVTGSQFFVQIFTQVFNQVSTRVLVQTFIRIFAQIFVHAVVQAFVQSLKQLRVRLVTVKGLLLVAAVMAVSFMASVPSVSLATLPPDRCEDAFARAELVSLPSAYGLSPKDTAKALAMPQTRELTRTLAEAANVIEATRDTDLGVPGFFLPSVRLPELENLIKSSVLPPRPFPELFYRTHLAHRGAPEPELRLQYERIHRIIQWTRFKPVSDEALVLLAFAGRDLPKVIDPRTIPPAVAQRAVKDAIDSLIKESEQSLPPYAEFVNSTNALFIEFAVINRRENIQNNAKLMAKAELMTEEAFRSLLASRLTASADLKLVNKIALAIEIMEPVMANAGNHMFHWALSSRSHSRNNEKWRKSGAFFLTQLQALIATDTLALSHEFFDEGKEEAADAIIASTDKAIERLAGGIDTSAAAFLRTIVEKISERVGTLIHLDEQKVHSKMLKELRTLTDEVKAQVFENDQRAKKLNEERIRAERAAARITPAPVVTFARTKSPQSQNQDRALGRGTIRALQMELRNDESKVGTNVALASEPVFVAPEGQSVDDLKLESLVPNERYWFRQFRRPSHDSSQSASAPEAVQYVEFSKKLIDQLRDKRQDLESWMNTFLIGPVFSKEENGLKPLQGANAFVWEIKDRGSSFRIIVKQDKATRTWRWVELTHHGHVKRALRRNSFR